MNTLYSVELLSAARSAELRSQAAADRLVRLARCCVPGLRARLAAVVARFAAPACCPA